MSLFVVFLFVCFLFVCLYVYSFCFVLFVFYTTVIEKGNRFVNVQQAILHSLIVQ